MDEGKGRWSLGSRAARRSVAIGVVGAAGAIAALRRRRRSSVAPRARGIAAFEDAPCFVEARSEAPPHGVREPE
jgi:hypothetical protein